MPIHTHDAITARRSITAAIFLGSSHPKNAVQTKQDTQFASGSIPSGTVAMTQRIQSAHANENYSPKYKRYNKTLYSHTVLLSFY